MKILLLSETLVAGGAETFVIRLANALAARHQVVLAIMHGQRVEPALAGQIDLRVRVEALELPAERWLWRVDGLLRRARVDLSLIRAAQRRWLRAIIGREQPDVIHSHLFKADRLAAEVRQGSENDPAHVITLHGDYAPYLQGQADPQMLHAAAWMGRTLDQADAVVAICSPHLQHLRADFPSVEGKVHLIYNGYARPQPSADAASLAPGKFRFAMVSRGVEQKGWAVAVEAFARLDRHDAELVLVGEGPAIARLRKLNPAGVLFVGFSPSPADWIVQCNACLLPTLFPHESLPTAVMEYLACGKPVIATDVGEIGAMITAPDGRRAGLLLPLEEGTVSADRLASAMARVMDDDALRGEMAKIAREAFPRFGMDRCVTAYEQLYRSVAASPSTSAIH